MKQQNATTHIILFLSPFFINPHKHNSLSTNSFSIHCTNRHINLYNIHENLMLVDDGNATFNY